MAVPSRMGKTIGAKSYPLEQIQLTLPIPEGKRKANEARQHPLALSKKKVLSAFSKGAGSCDSLPAVPRKERNLPNFTKDQEGNLIQEAPSKAFFLLFVHFDKIGYFFNSLSQLQGLLKKLKARFLTLTVQLKTIADPIINPNGFMMGQKGK